MKDNKPIWFGLAVAAIAIVVLVVVYADKSRQLTETENRVQQLQAQLEERDKKIKGLEESAASTEEQLASGRDENKELRQHIETLGKCLDGVKSLGDAENYAEVMLIVGAMNEPCSKSETILNKLRAK